MSSTGKCVPGAGRRGGSGSALSGPGTSEQLTACYPRPPPGVLSEAWRLVRGSELVGAGATRQQAVSRGRGPCHTHTGEVQVDRPLLLQGGHVAFYSPAHCLLLHVGSQLLRGTLVGGRGEATGCVSKYPGDRDYLFIIDLCKRSSCCGVANLI